MFKCYYPVSTYEKDYFTIHDEEYICFSLYETDKENITVEDLSIIIDNDTIKQQAINLINKMSDEDIKKIIEHLIR